MGSLDNVFNPGSVALIGARDKEGSVGRIVLTNLFQDAARIKTRRNI
jgi:acetyltransferase